MLNKLSDLFSFESEIPFTMRLMRWFISFFFLVFLGLSTAGGAAADTQSSSPDSDGSELPESLTPDAMSALVEKLDPEQVTALDNLMKLLSQSVDSPGIQATADTPGITTVLKGWLAGFQASVVSHTRGLPELLSDIGGAIGAIFDGRSATGSAIFLGILILAVAIGAGAEWLFNRATAGSRERIRSTAPETFGETVRTLTLRVMLELGGLVVFIVAGLAANRLLNSDPIDRFLIAAFLLQAILILRVMAALLRFVLAPHRADLRLVSTDDWTARFLYRNFASIAGFVGVAFFLASVLELYQIRVIDTLRFWVGLIGSAWLIYVLWKGRQGLTSILKGEETNLTAGLERMAAWWPGVTVAIVGFNWVFLQFVLSAGNEALTPARGASALALIVLAPFLDTVIRGIATHLVPPMQGEGPVAEAAHQETRLSYVRIGRIVLLAVLIIAVGKLWGVGLRNLAEAGLGVQLAANAAGVLLILAVGYLAWEVVNLWVNRQLARDVPAAGEHAEGGGAGGAGRSRLATILPIVHMALQITIITLTVLLALSQLGVNITPLLAGAGVLGLAIGFGAQTLVKDIVSGVFFLLDDAFRVGEFIDVGGGTMGLVEKISLRSLQLRGATGPVHIVPYGDMSKLTNLSRDWTIMKLRFTVPFDTDLEKVRKIFKKIGQQIMENPEHAENLIKPFKSQGAGRITESGIVVKGKFVAKPGVHQFAIRKEIYALVQKAFEENGIEFAQREVRVSIPDLPEDAHLSAKRKAAISRAAGAAADDTAVKD